MTNKNTYTKTSFDYCYPVNQNKAKSELDHLDQTIKDLTKAKLSSMINSAIFCNFPGTIFSEKRISNVIAIKAKLIKNDQIKELVTGNDFM